MKLIRNFMLNLLNWIQDLDYKLSQFEIIKFLLLELLILHLYNSSSLFVNFWKSEIRILYEPVMKLGKGWKFERSSLFALFIVFLMFVDL